eukprot:6104063-Amphidinium_carterae.1
MQHGSRTCGPWMQMVHLSQRMAACHYMQKMHAVKLNVLVCFQHGKRAQIAQSSNAEPSLWREDPLMFGRPKERPKSKKTSRGAKMRQAGVSGSSVSDASIGTAEDAARLSDSMA